MKRVPTTKSSEHKRFRQDHAYFFGTRSASGFMPVTFVRRPRNLSAEAMQRVRKSGAPKQQLAAWTSILADRTGVAVVNLQAGFAATDIEIVVLVERQAVGIGGQTVDPHSLARQLAGAGYVVSVNPLSAGVGHIERAVVGRKPHAVGLEADGRYPRHAAFGRTVVNVLLHHGRLAAVLVIGIGEIEPAVEVDRQIVRLVEVLAVDLGAQDAFAGA